MPSSGAGCPAQHLQPVGFQCCQFTEQSEAAAVASLHSQHRTEVRELEEATAADRDWLMRRIVLG